MSLSGKTCIITGGAGGLGKAITQNFLASGARCIVLDINDTLLTSISSELSPQYGDKLVVLKCNVASEASIKATYNEILKDGGSAEILVNNAGIPDRFDGVAECELEMWQKVMDINLTGPFLMTKYAVEHFREKGIKGSVINIGSVASTRGGVAGCAYTASKHGLLGLTKNTAAYYGEFGIRCNVIMPGGMATNIGENFKTTGMNEFGYGKMMKVMAVCGEDTLVDQDKVAKMCVYLAKDEGDVFNGAAISADKGWTSY